MSIFQFLSQKQSNQSVPQNAEPCRPTQVYSARESNQERIRALNRIAMMKQTQSDGSEQSTQPSEFSIINSIIDDSQLDTASLQVDKEVSVQPGETLYGIAQREMGDGAKYQELARYNNISNPNVISVGQIIRIPSSINQASGQSDSLNENTQTVEQEHNLEDSKLFEAIGAFSDRIGSSDKNINPARNKDGSARTDWNGWCAATMSWFVQDKYQNGIGNGYGNGYGKSGTANQAREMSGLQQAINENPNHSDYTKAPVGAFHWWSGGRYGHVGLDVTGGGEHIFMATGMQGNETIAVGQNGSHLKVVNIEDYNQKYSKYTYEGWTTNYCGAEIDSELLQTKNTVEND